MDWIKRSPVKHSVLLHVIAEIHPCNKRQNDYSHDDDDDDDDHDDDADACSHNRLYTCM